MKLHLNWLKDAKYSNKYVTDNVLFVNRSFVYIPEDFGYRKMNSLWEEELDKAFRLCAIDQINKTDKTRTYAKTKITRYRTNNNYVTLNSEYEYLWNSSNTQLYSLQKCNDIQYRGLIGIFENNILKAVLTPIIVEDKHLFDDNFWINVDEKIGLGKFIK